MGVFDLIILGLLALFAGVGALRGPLRELLSLGVWLTALAGGWLFADAVGTWFEPIEDVELRRVLGFMAIVLVMLVLLSLTAFVLRQLLPRPAPSLGNRVLGTLLGALRGIAVVVVLVLLAGLTSLPNQDGWRDSPLVGVFQPAARTILDWLPAPVARQFRYG